MPIATRAAAVLALALLPAAISISAAAQEWPQRQSIKLVVPFGPGSATDIAGRTSMEQVGRQIGQSIITENRGGAGTTIGTSMVAKADPDGYTVLANSTSFAVTAVTYGKLPYNPHEDLAPVGMVAHLPFTIATRTRYKTLADFVAEGRKQPSPLNYGSNGPRNPGHLFI